MNAPRLILASASPRRRELLQQLGVASDCRPADIDETRAQNEPPEDYVQRMAVEKARAVAALFPAPDYAVLGADTTVVLDDQALGKPVNHMDALGILARLSGRSHRVLTSVCLLGPAGEQCELVSTDVEFLSLDRQTCEAYLATEEPWDKAGAYGIQGLGGAFVRSIRGSYSNVVGLPLCETWQMLRAGGIATALDAPQSIEGERQ